MTESPSNDRAPYGLESLRWIPRPVYLLMVGLGVAGLAGSTQLQGAARGGTLLLGLVLTDIGVEGLGLKTARWLRVWIAPRLGWIVLGTLVAGMVALLVHHASRRATLNEQKAAVMASSRQKATIVAREEAGIQRRDDLLFVPIAGAGTNQSLQDVAVFDDLERLPASILSEHEHNYLILETSIGANEERTLDVYFGAPPLMAGWDPETGWDLGDAYKRGIESFAWQALDPTATDGVPPFCGATSLRIHVRPRADLDSTFLWSQLPVAAPRQISETTQLLYAIRTAGPTDLEVGVAVKTDQGYSWERPLPGPDGQPDLGLSPSGGRAADRWFLRRVPLRNFAGAQLQGVGVAVLYADSGPHASADTTFYVDAIRLVDGPPLEGSFSLSPPGQ